MNQPSIPINRGLVAGLAVIGIVLGAAGSTSPAQAANKPNILVIMGDDTGVSNISAYTHGLMG